MTCEYLFATAGVATFALGLVGTSWQAIRAIDAEQLADSRLAKETELRRSADAERERADLEANRAKIEKSNAVREAATSKHRRANDGSWSCQAPGAVAHERLAAP